MSNSEISKKKEMMGIEHEDKFIELTNFCPNQLLDNVEKHLTGMEVLSKYHTMMSQPGFRHIVTPGRNSYGNNIFIGANKQ